MTEPAHREWSTELKKWIYPGYPDEPGQPNAAILKASFWEAVRRCESKFSYVGSESNGDEGVIDSFIPEEFFEHMAVAISELRAAADGPRFSDTFDRTGNGTLGGYYDQSPTPWNPGRLYVLGAAEAPSVRCLICGHVVTLKEGESIPFDDPRLCEHAGKQPWPVIDVAVREDQP
jgi:hypothetical protein